MTDHPCKGMTKAQRQWFERIATGASGDLAAKKTIAALLARGVVVRAPDRVLGDWPLAVHVKVYDIPEPIFRQWCQWCSETVGFP